MKFNWRNAWVICFLVLVVCAMAQQQDDGADESDEPTPTALTAENVTATANPNVTEATPAADPTVENLK